MYGIYLLTFLPSIYTNRQLRLDTINTPQFYIQKKGAKVQQQIARLQSQVAAGGSAEQKRKEAEKLKKEAEKKAAADAKAEVAALFKPVQVQKIPFGADPKSVLCVYFKAGNCDKGEYPTQRGIVSEFGVYKRKLTQRLGFRKEMQVFPRPCCRAENSKEGPILR